MSCWTFVLAQPLCAEDSTSVIMLMVLLCNFDRPLSNLVRVTFKYANSYAPKSSLLHDELQLDTDGLISPQYYHYLRYR